MARRIHKPVWEEWTLREMRLLEAHYGRMTRKQLVARYLPERTIKSAERMARLLNVSRRRPPVKHWTPLDLERLRLLYGTMENAELCRIHFPGVSPQAVGHRAMRLGLRSKEFPWTKAEDRLLRLWYGRMTNRELAALHLPRRTPAALEGRGRKLGLTGRTIQPWTRRELRQLQQHYPTNSIQDVARLLPGRTANAIRTQAVLAGLKKALPSRLWNSRELALVRRFYERENGLQLLSRKLPGRTRLSIQQQARKLGLSLNGKPWTTKEDTLLRRLFTKFGYTASIPNRTPDSVRGRAQKLGLRFLPPAPPGSRRGLEWSTEELRILRENRNLSPKALAAMLQGRSYTSITGKRSALGIDRTAGSGARSTWSAQEESILQRHAGANPRDLLPLLPGRTYGSIRKRLSLRT